MNSLASSARMLFRAALLISVVTIVIGILNGMDVWDPPHNLLMTHVHAGTLGWITLAVVGAAMVMFDDDRAEPASGRSLAGAAIAATVLYVGAFALTTGILRPMTGVLMLAAIVWVLVWVWGRYGRSVRSTAQLGLVLSLVSLTIGAVLGVILGLFIARGEVPGLSSSTAAAIAGAHPPAMLVGYLVLAGAAIAHWLLDGPQTRPGRFVMWALFACGIAANLAFILGIDALVQVATVLEVAAIVTFLVHIRRSLVPSGWAGDRAGSHARIGALFLLLGVVLLVYVVQLVVAGELNPETGEGPIGVLLAFDHSMFIGVMTNVLFALVARTGHVRASSAVLWGVNVGLVVFLAGLVADIPILERIGAPVMGLALLAGVAVLFRQASAPRPVPVV